MKLIGIFCILSGCTGLGLTFARELEQRILELHQLQQLMIALKGEIRYMHQPLPEAFLHLSGNAPEPFRTFFLKTALDLQRRSGQTAKEIWKKNMDLYLPALHISRQEQKELEKLGSMLGYLDVEMQVNALEYYLEQLKQSGRLAEDASRNKKRLYQYMGALGGAALVILIF